MIKKLLKKNFMQELLAFIAALYIRLVFLTNRWTYIGFQYPEAYIKQKKPFIVCFWHGRLLLVCKAWPKGAPSFHMLISAHNDGRLISKTVRHFNIATTAGSTRRGGVKALKSLLSLLKEKKVVGFTPDGPRGPGSVASIGIVTTAYLAGVDILPVTFSTSRHKRISSWDSFFLSLPFGRGVLAWGEPIKPAATKADLPACQEKVQKALDALNEKADQLCEDAC